MKRILSVRVNCGEKTCDACVRRLFYTCTLFGSGNSTSTRLNEDIGTARLLRCRGCRAAERRAKDVHRG